MGQRIRKWNTKKIVILYTLSAVLLSFLLTLFYISNYAFADNSEYCITNLESSDKLQLDYNPDTIMNCESFQLQKNVNDEYLGFTAIDNSASVCLFNFGQNLNNDKNFSYSFDSEVWNTYTIGSWINIPKDNIIYFKGDSSNLSDDDITYQFAFDGVGRINASGDITSLINHNTRLEPHTFKWLFANCTSLITSPDLSKIVSIGESGCAWMFSECSKLVSVREFSSLEKICNFACEGMFENCTSLVTAPDMPKLENIEEKGCDWMFWKCTSLVAMPNMSKLNTIKQSGCAWMFSECSKLVSVREFSSLKTICNLGCEGMFENCTSLVTAPDMPKLEYIEEKGCDWMFGKCTSLVAMPIMSKLNTIKQSGCAWMFSECYKLESVHEFSSLETIYESGCEGMFENCISLTAAPDMPNMVSYGKHSLRYMYDGCTNMKYVKVNFTEWNNATTLWLKNVSDSGTFVCSVGLEEKRGEDYIPDGWTIVRLEPEIINDEPINISTDSAKTGDESLYAIFFLCSIIALSSIISYKSLRNKRS